MQIQPDTVATIFYRLHEADGAVLEDNAGQIPLAYLHGRGNLLQALEAALEGKSEGDSLSVTLSPEQAYGPILPNSTKRVPIKHLLSKHKRLLAGSLVKIQTERGPIDARVVKVGKFNVDVDFNHPFAGKTLIFDITVDKVRPATPDELSHGHAHGPGGHHH